MTQAKAREKSLAHHSNILIQNYEIKNNFQEKVRLASTRIHDVHNLRI